MSLEALAKTKLQVILQRLTYNICSAPVEASANGPRAIRSFVLLKKHQRPASSNFLSGGHGNFYFETALSCLCLSTETYLNLVPPISLSLSLFLLLPQGVNKGPLGPPILLFLLLSLSLSLSLSL